MKSYIGQKGIRADSQVTGWTNDHVEVRVEPNPTKYLKSRAYYRTLFQSGSGPEPVAITHFLMLKDTVPKIIIPRASGFPSNPRYNKFNDYRVEPPEELRRVDSPLNPRGWGYKRGICQTVAEDENPQIVLEIAEAFAKEKGVVLYVLETRSNQVEIKWYPDGWEPITG